MAFPFPGTGTIVEATSPGIGPSNCARASAAQVWHTAPTGVRAGCGSSASAPAPPWQQDGAALAGLSVTLICATQGLAFARLNLLTPRNFGVPP